MKLASSLVAVVWAAVMGLSTACYGAGNDFYRGKTITLVMGTGPGGSYDLYGRLIEQFWGRHIPGDPTIVVQYMPGAGGIVAGNYVYNVGRQDGTVVLMAHPLPLFEKLGPTKGIKFQSIKFNWIGTYDSIAEVMALWHTAPSLDIKDPKGLDVIGTFNKTHLTYQWSVLTKNTLGSNFRVVTGYPSGNDLNLAMERGEISGWVIAWTNLVGTKPDWLKEKKVDIPLQYTPERLADLPEVPTLLELAPADKKDIVKFVTTSSPFSRALAMGPGVPAANVAVLRKAFDAMMKDPEFLAEAQRRKLAIDPRNAKQVQVMLATIMSASPALVGRVKKAIGEE